MPYGLFIDGTLKHNAPGLNGRGTLVAKLHDLWDGPKDYIPGIGSGSNGPIRWLKAWTGWGARKKVRQAVDALEQWYTFTSLGGTVFLFGFSRGCAIELGVMREIRERYPNLKIVFVAIDSVFAFGDPLLFTGLDRRWPQEPPPGVHGLHIMAMQESTPGFRLHRYDSPDVLELWAPGGHGVVSRSVLSQAEIMVFVNRFGAQWHESAPKYRWIGFNWYDSPDDIPKDRSVWSRSRSRLFKRGDSFVPFLSRGDDA